MNTKRKTATGRTSRSRTTRRSRAVTKHPTDPFLPAAGEKIKPRVVEIIAYVLEIDTEERSIYQNVSIMGSSLGLGASRAQCKELIETVEEVFGIGLLSHVESSIDQVRDLVHAVKDALVE